MPDNITIKLAGLEDLENRIDHLSAKLSVALDRKETKMSIGEILIARARATIKQGGNPLWTPIKQRTIDERWNLEQKKKPARRVNKLGIVSNAPLQRSGVGINSLNYALTGEGIILKAVKYMGYQQTGTKPFTIKPKNKKALLIPGIGFRKWANHPGIPARPFFIVTDEDIADIRDIVIDDITSQA